MYSRYYCTWYCEYGIESSLLSVSVLCYHGAIRLIYYTIYTLAILYSRVVFREVTISNDYLRYKQGHF